MESQEEEKINIPTTSGRTRWELQHILQHAEDFIGAPRNDERERRQRDKDKALVDQFGEPYIFQESFYHQLWVDVMVEEYSSIMVNDVWELLPRPQDRSVVGSRWIYKIQICCRWECGEIQSQVCG